MLVVDATTSYALTPGALTTIGDVPVSVGSSNIVASGSTIAVPTTRASGSQTATSYTGVASRDKSKVCVWLTFMVLCLVLMLLG